MAKEVKTRLKIVNLEIEESYESENPYEPSKTRTFKYEGGSFKNHPIYVTPEIGAELVNMDRREWKRREREQRCLIPSEHFGTVVCRGKCSECPLVRNRNSVSLEGYIEEHGHEPTEGGFRELQEAEDPRVKIDKEERDARIREIINSVDPEAYEILYMRFVDGFSIQEIADIKKMPISTMRRRIIKMVKELQDKKAELYEG